MIRAWADKTRGGGDVPYLLVAALGVHGIPNTVQRIAARLGRRPGATSGAAHAAVMMDGGRAALALGRDRIGDVPVTSRWTTLAGRNDGAVVLLGMTPAPVGIDRDRYLERYDDGLVTCPVPVVRGASVVAPWADRR